MNFKNFNVILQKKRNICFVCHLTNKTIDL